MIAILANILISSSFCLDIPAHNIQPITKQAHPYNHNHNQFILSPLSPRNTGTRHQLRCNPCSWFQSSPCSISCIAPLMGWSAREMLKWRELLGKLSSCCYRLLPLLYFGNIGNPNLLNSVNLVKQKNYQIRYFFA